LTSSSNGTAGSCDSWSRTGSPAAAKELLQAAFVKVVERGGELRDAESAVAWFYRLLRNALIDFYRHRDAERGAFDRQAAEAPLVVEVDPELEAAICECIHGLIPTLKKEYTEGRSITDVARDLGITPGNAAVRLHRGRLALKSH